MTGSAGTTAGLNFVGTTDDQPLELEANGGRVMRYEPAMSNAFEDVSPNLIGGDAGNMVEAGIQGATISGGGGLSGKDLIGPNLVQADFGTIGGGFHNLVSGPLATISGGESNVASADGASVLGGLTNVASGPYAIVAGGTENQADGFGSFAAGSEADAAFDGTFVWSDASKAVPFLPLGPNEFAARAAGGVRFVTAVDSFGNPTAGVHLSAGSSAWSTLSDRNAKANFKPVNSEEVVRELDAIPVLTWNYKTQNPLIRHIGPMAQDFYAAFKVGEDNRHITTLDSEGVALAAIQGLYAMVQEKDAQIAALRRDDARRDAQLTGLTRELQTQQVRLEVLEHNAAVGRIGVTPARAIAN